MWVYPPVPKYTDTPARTAIKVTHETEISRHLSDAYLLTNPPSPATIHVNRDVTIVLVPRQEGNLPQTPVPHTFFFGPFRITSQIDIPELRNVTGSGRIHVNLTLTETPVALPGAVPFGDLCQLTPTQYLLDIPGVARYYVSDGREIQLTLHPGAPRPDVSTYLLGSVFGALCHQNRLLPLHASAVERDGAVAAFLGDSGSGKSTLAAALQRRGHAIISDDICLLEEQGNSMHVVPVAGWLKLWKNSLDHLGEVPDERHRVFADDDKYRLYLHPHPGSGAPPTLRQLVFLERAASPDQPPRLHPLSTAETIARMMRLTYLGYITELTRSHARIFGQCALALRNAHAWRLVAPWDLAQLDSTLHLLESTLLTPAKPTATN